jgi:hypothetical protein
MLNLPIAMMLVLILFLTLSTAGFQAATPQPQTPIPEIQVSDPLPGAALQGSVVISGSVDLPGFHSYEVSFSYPEGGAGSWFLVQQSQTNVKEGVLGVWDTSKIADGKYLLKVEVTLADGSKVGRIIPDLRVRNYTAIETNTPTPQPSKATTQATLAVSLTPTLATSTTQPTPTDIPANPLQIQPVDLAFNMTLGISFVVVIFVLLGLYGWFKGRSH